MIGNHDVTGRFDQTPDKAPFFYTFFPTPGYQVMDFGDYLSLILLDSGHTHPVDGAQKDWLYQMLYQRQNVPHKFAFYHVPAYPCVRPYKGTKSQFIREQWVPIFEKFHLDVAFEHHDHAYKRTFAIRKGKKKRHGVIYMGDGAWGVERPRIPRRASWYLAKAQSIRHFILVTLDKDTRHFKAISHRGDVFDTFTQ